MFEDGKSNDNELVSLARGISMIILGTGLILSNPNVRRFLMSQLNGRLSEPESSLQGLTGLLPDLERYMKMRSM
jgi:hypothetical protein